MRKPISKYGWEICDEVQRFIGNSSEIQFVPLSAFEALQKRCGDLKTALSEKTYFHSDEQIEKELLTAKSEIERLTRECISTFLHEQRMNEAAARIKELEMILETYLDNDHCRETSCPFPTRAMCNNPMHKSVRQALKK